MRGVRQPVEEVGGREARDPMNLRRTLSRHQLLYLREIASGKIVLLLDEEGEAYRSPSGGHSVSATLTSKPRGHMALWGGHFYSSIIEMRQRGLLVDRGGRLVPSDAARRQFGSPPPTPVPPRTFVMSRTRAARFQGAP
jgi:hypothetical protein